MAKKKRATLKAGQKQVVGRNWQDVVHRLVDGFFDLASADKLFGIALLGVVFGAFMLLYKLPEEKAYEVLWGIGSFISSQGFPLIVLFLLLCGTAIGCKRMRKFYLSEIERLVEFRRTLVHGVDDGSLTPMKKHTSTGFNLNRDFGG